jgi:glucose-6-phosphate dehydrogenase assembly protein OpcA
MSTTHTLTDTTSAAIAAEFVRARTRAGSPAMGMVMTLVVMVDDAHSEDAIDAAREASLEHPARVLTVVSGTRRGRGSVDAEVTVGQGWGGEMALIRLSGEVVDHADTVVLPLLLPDSPVAVWWPAECPVDPAKDPVGALATRRITDAAGDTGHARALLVQASAYSPGNTDLAWTRITPWRALLAAALDQADSKVLGASVASERPSPSADLLAAWLESRLKVPVTRAWTEGPGITDVSLDTRAGLVRIRRSDGRLASFTSPGRPDVPIALKRREVPELLMEELRRLDEDDVYAATMRFLHRQQRSQHPRNQKGRKS